MTGSDRVGCWKKKSVPLTRVYRKVYQKVHQEDLQYFFCISSCLHFLSNMPKRSPRLFGHFLKGIKYSLVSSQRAFKILQVQFFQMFQYDRGIFCFVTKQNVNLYIQLKKRRCLRTFSKIVRGFSQKFARSIHVTFSQNSNLCDSPFKPAQSRQTLNIFLTEVSVLQMWSGTHVWYPLITQRLNGRSTI